MWVAPSPHMGHPTRINPCVCLSPPRHPQAPGVAPRPRPPRTGAPLAPVGAAGRERDPKSGEGPGGLGWEPPLGTTRGGWAGAIKGGGWAAGSEVGLAVTSLLWDHGGLVPCCLHPRGPISVPPTSLHPKSLRPFHPTSYSPLSSRPHLLKSLNPPIPTSSHPYILHPFLPTPFHPYFPTPQPTPPAPLTRAPITAGCVFLLGVAPPRPSQVMGMAPKSPNPLCGEGPDPTAATWGFFTHGVFYGAGFIAAVLVALHLEVLARGGALGPPLLGSPLPCPETTRGSPVLPWVSPPPLAPHSPPLGALSQWVWSLGGEIGAKILLLGGVPTGRAPRGRTPVGLGSPGATSGAKMGKTQKKAASKGQP